MMDEYEDEFKLLKSRSNKSNKLIKEYWERQMPCIAYGEDLTPYRVRLFSFKTKYIVNRISSV